MSKSFEPRIIVLSPVNISHLFKSLSGDTFLLDESESPVLSLSLHSDELKILFPDLNQDYKIKWIQPPLITHLGRDLWITLSKFQPNIFFIFLDQGTDFDYYKGILQNVYVRLLELLDEDMDLAEIKAREVDILFLVFYKYRSMVIHHLVQLMLFFNSFKKVFQNSNLHEKELDLDNISDIEIVKTLLWTWELNK
ncbi:MAG: hypothetical protein ACW981_14890 [Candidatus Hodarchaeales archaeon]